MSLWKTSGGSAIVKTEGGKKSLDCRRRTRTSFEKKHLGLAADATKSQSLLPRELLSQVPTPPDCSRLEEAVRS